MKRIPGCFLLSLIIAASGLRVSAAETDWTDLALVERVADWQLSHESRHPVTSWIRAPFYAGLMALSEVSKNPRFREAAHELGERSGWKLGTKPGHTHYHADYHAVGQMYAEMYALARDPRMIADMRAKFDDILAHPKDDNLSFDRAKNPDRLDRWSWCDSLFMAPPAWARLSAVTGDKKYLEFAVAKWRVTSDYLYDPEEHLYFRDSTFFEKREANGRKVFWSRGNGWVMAGFARFLPYLPADHPQRPWFVAQFRAMAGKLITCQQTDGLWRASLLDPDSFPLQETSGSAFYAYALAWGINEGLLDPVKFRPAVLNAWEALKRCVAADGRLAHVQPVGADPRSFPADSTEAYGVGGFILAGTEISKLAGAPEQAAVSASARARPRWPEPDYHVPYGAPAADQIVPVLDRVLTYLEEASPVRIIDRDSGAIVSDLAKLPRNAALDRTDFLLTSYEWGVTYNGMLAAAEATGNPRYRDYVAGRFRAIAAVATHLKKQMAAPGDAAAGGARMYALRGVLSPQSLDDSGAMNAAMIKAARAGILTEELRPWIENYTAWIAEKQFRLPDGTLARNRPHHNTLWLDDLYMSVPALAQMSAFTGDNRYLDDAVRQVLQFSERMFVPATGLYRHGWVQAMRPHPNFYWARANGWAVVAMAELLSVLPPSHASYEAVLSQFRGHVAGLAAYQSDRGTWHQLLNRPDSYLETSASAMFCYAIARGINRGWLDPLACGPMAALAWNGIAAQVNARGQVENTCIGTGMGFDPAFYYHRPVSAYAPHGYGPVLLAGAEMILLARGAGVEANINDGSLQYAPSPSRH